MKVKNEITNLLNEMKGKVGEIYFVACGGSLVDMYGANYFLKAESEKITTGIYTANEFNHVLPKKIGKQSVVFVCSHGGDTKESVTAAKIAQSKGAKTIGLTYNKSASLLDYSDVKVVYEWGTDADVKNNPMAIILECVVEIVNKVEGYAYTKEFIDGMDRINGIIVKAIDQVSKRSDNFAKKYEKEDFFYIMGSGASYGHVYGFSICSLMEMQWLNASPIHSGEYFHGPFEVTDANTPYVLLMNEGKTRALDERAKEFLAEYANKVEIVDAKELGLSVIDETVVDYFNPILFYSVLGVYREKLANIRQHPLETRRYMGKVIY